MALGTHMYHIHFLRKNKYVTIGQRPFIFHVHGAVTFFKNSFTFIKAYNRNKNIQNLTINLVFLLITNLIIVTTYTFHGAAGN